MRGPKWNEKTIQRFLSEGRGKGSGIEYKPWLTVQDISSLGNSRRVYGLKTGREHHLFSNVEWELFLLLEWAPDVVDIREQFPLDRDSTLEIAASLGIKHPYYPGTHVPTVMTVDTLVTRIQQGKKVLEAFNAKRTEEAEDTRSLEKLEIHRHYFEAMEVPHRIVFHSEIPHQVTMNIEFIRGASLRPDETEVYQGFFQDHQRQMAPLLNRSKRDGSLAEFCAYYESQFGLEPGIGLRIAKLLMLNRIIEVDLDNPSLVSAPMASFRVRKQTSDLRIVGGM